MMPQSTQNNAKMCY